MNMGNSTVSTIVRARVPNEFMKLKKEWETITEFVLRAMKALRAHKVPEYQDRGNPLEHALLIKMIKVFAKKNIRMDLSQDEIELVRRLYKE